MYTHRWPPMLLLALGLWLCAAPLAAVILLPLAGRRGAFVGLLLLLAAAVAACWALCRWRGAGSRC